MCGRFTLTNPSPRRLADRFSFDLDAGFEIDERPRFNIAPTDPVLTIRRHVGGGSEIAARNEPGNLRWGLLREDEDRRKRPLINVRVESIARGSFAEAVRDRRCLIPADGFYEWRKDPKGKRPTWISRPGRELFAFAAIWNPSPPSGELPASCALLTREPNDKIRPVHDRMPMILDRKAEASWLDPDTPVDELAELLGPVPENLLELTEVGDAVNNVREDGPHLLDPPMRLF